MSPYADPFSQLFLKGPSEISECERPHICSSNPKADRPLPTKAAAQECFIGLSFTNEEPRCNPTRLPQDKLRIDARRSRRAPAFRSAPPEGDKACSMLAWPISFCMILSFSARVGDGRDTGRRSIRTDAVVANLL